MPKYITPLWSLTENCIHFDGSHELFYRYGYQKSLNAYQIFILNTQTIQQKIITEPKFIAKALNFSAVFNDASIVQSMLDKHELNAENLLQFKTRNRNCNRKKYRNSSQKKNKIPAPKTDKNLNVIEYMINFNWFASLKIIIAHDSIYFNDKQILYKLIYLANRKKHHRILNLLIQNNTKFAISYIKFFQIIFLLLKNRKFTLIKNFLYKRIYSAKNNTTYKHIDSSSYTKENTCCSLQNIQPNYIHKQKCKTSDKLQTSVIQKSLNLTKIST